MYDQMDGAPMGAPQKPNNDLFKQLAQRMGSAGGQMGSMQPMAPMQGQPMGGGQKPMPGPMPGQDGGLAPPGLGPRIDGGSMDRPLPELLSGGSMGMPGGMGGAIGRMMPPMTKRFGYQGGGFMGGMMDKVKQGY